ncbi:MAG TPA: SGNH/GDSL hydrolase family protein [Pedococcus sp.]|nr:SGNH/GDSL hydrolase family protein [Pedococcus sp.]
MGARAWVLGHARPGLTAIVGGVVLAAALSSTTGWHSAAAADHLVEVRAALGGRGAVVVSVLGDSTGNEDGEWVDLWARSLGATRQVVLHQWDDVRGGWLPRARMYGQHGPVVTIWNGSKSGAQAGYARARLAAIQPERPDLVLYSFGHNHSPGDVVGPMRALVSAVDGRWPGTPASAVILQNPQLGATAAKHAHVVAELTLWAAGTGLPTIDVYGAFEVHADEASLFKDFRHPSPAGSALWAAVVEEAITPAARSR